MFQVCVPETGKQEVNIPLGVLKSKFNWKIFLWKQYFLPLQCALLSMQVANKDKSSALYFYPTISFILLGLGSLFFFFFLHNTGDNWVE